MESNEKKRLKILKIGGERGKKGKEYEVMEEDKDLGAGIFNTVRRAEVSIKDAPEYKHSFVLKRPRLDFEGSRPKTEEEIKKVLREIALYVGRYQDLKKAGIRHLPTTYQIGGIDETDPAIVMTDFSENGRKLVLSNNTAKNGHELSDVLNIKPLFEEMKRDVERLTKAGYWAAMDSYFFIVPKDERVVANMGYSLADFDQCYPSRTEDADSWELYQRNINEASGALQHVLGNHLKDNDKLFWYTIEIRRWADEALESFKNSKAS